MDSSSSAATSGASYTDLLTKSKHRDPLIRHAVITAALTWAVGARTGILAKIAAVGGVTLLRRPESGKELERLIEGGTHALSHLVDAVLIAGTINLWRRGSTLLALPATAVTALWLGAEGATATTFGQTKLKTVTSMRQRPGLTLGTYAYKLLWQKAEGYQQPKFLKDLLAKTEEEK